VEGRSTYVGSSNNARASSDSEGEPCVLNRLEALDEEVQTAYAVTIVQSRKDECNNKRMEHCSGCLRPVDSLLITGGGGGGGGSFS